MSRISAGWIPLAFQTFFGPEVSVVSDPWLQALYSFRQFVFQVGSHLACHLLYPAGPVRRAQSRREHVCMYTARNSFTIRIYSHLTISILFGVVEPQGPKLLQHLCLLHLRICVMDTQTYQTYFQKDLNVQFTKLHYDLEPLINFLSVMDDTVTSGNNSCRRTRFFTLSTFVSVITRSKGPI